jgi:hypothetical protein
MPLCWHFTDEEKEMLGTDTNVLLVFVTNDSDVPTRQPSRYQTSDPAQLIEAIKALADSQHWTVDQLTPNEIDVYGSVAIKTMRGLIAQVAGRAAPKIATSSMIARIRRGEDHADACRGWQDGEPGAD